jgi:uncharacterized membrane protein YphA (DoxX/SURF4 family)
MNLTLWIVQGLLAFAFIAVGSLKLFAYEKFKAQSEKKGPVGITRGLAAFIGFAEITGGLGIVLPMANNIAPVCRRKTKGPYARPGSLRRNPMNPSNS